MSQELRPTDGGIERITLNSANPQGIFLSPQYTEVRGLTPRDTEWKPGGRPIYDRLPGVSERYKLDYPYDDNVAYVYIPPGEGYTGLVSMAVQASGDGKFLVIQAGSITWKYGTLQTQPVIIDLEFVGIGSAKYLLAYQMYYDDSPQQFEYAVSDYNLTGEELKIESSVDSISGWRYTPQFAFSNLFQRWWSNQDGIFPENNQSAFLSWEDKLGSSLTNIVLRCPNNSSEYTGKATIYYMSCGGLGEDGYCENPEWNFHQTVEIQRDSQGQFFQFSFEEPIPTKGWKVEWTDSRIAINNIAVSGVLFKTKRPEAATTNYALVAYPVNSVPSTFVNGAGEEVPLTLCKLAHVDIDSSYTVLDIKDIREVVYKNYEPITEWLTRFWDENLVDLYRTIDNYSENSLSPPTCMHKEYDSLSQVELPVIYDECP